MQSNESLLAEWQRAWRNYHVYKMTATARYCRRLRKRIRRRIRNERARQQAA